MAFSPIERIFVREKMRFKKIFVSAFFCWTMGIGNKKSYRRCTITMRKNLLPFYTADHGQEGFLKFLLHKQGSHFFHNGKRIPGIYVLISFSEANINRYITRVSIGS